MVDVEVGVFTHRPTAEYLEPFLASLGKTILAPFRTRLLVQAKGVHPNWSDLLDQMTGDVCVVCDEDIVFLEHGWLPRIVALLGDESVGAVGVGQVKTEEDMFDYVSGLTPRPSGPIDVLWFPGHVVATKKDRVGHVRPDTNIPGVKGMSDVDYSLAIRALGLRLVIDQETVVFHPHKPPSDVWRTDAQNPTLAEERDIYPKQVAYMIKKWGERYTELWPGNINPQVLPDIRNECQKVGVVCPW